MQIGNPLLEFDTDMNAQGDFFWSHGLISDSTHALLTSTCNYSQIMRWVYNISESLSPECYEVYNKSAGEIGGSVDPFDVLGDKCLSSVRFHFFTPVGGQREGEKKDLFVLDFDGNIWV